MASPAVRKRYRDAYAAARDDAARERATKAFEAQIFADDRDPRVFRRVGHDPRVQGFEACLAYVAREIEARALYERVRDFAFVAYGVQLDDAGIGIEGASTDPRFVALAEEAALQIVKALRRVRGLVGEPGEECPPAVARGTSTPWLWFVKRAHALLGLPPISEVAPVLESWSSTEDGVLASRDFSEFEIVDPAERAELEALVTAEAAEAIKPRVSL